MASNFSTASPVPSPPPIKKKKLTLLRRIFALLGRKPQPVHFDSPIAELLRTPVPLTSAQTTQPPPLPLPPVAGPTAVVSHPPMPTPQMALAPYYPPASSVPNTPAWTLPPPSPTPLSRYPTNTDTSESSEDHDEWDGYTPPSSVHESQFNHNLSGSGAVSNHPFTPIYPQIHTDSTAHLNNQFGAVVPLPPFIHHPSTSTYQIPSNYAMVPSNNVLGAHHLPALTHPQIPSTSLVPLNNTTNVAYTQTYEHSDASRYVRKSHTVSYLQCNGNQSSAYVDNSIHIDSGNGINFQSSRRQTLQYGGHS